MAKMPPKSQQKAPQNSRSNGTQEADPRRLQTPAHSPPYNPADNIDDTAESSPRNSVSPLTGIQVVYEDPWLLVVNKPSRVAVHADPENSRRREFSYPDLQTYLQKERGEQLTLFHRLDRDTSGLVVFGRSPEIRAEMNDLFEKKRIRKSYMAVVQGRWLPQWNRVETQIDRDENGRWFNRKEGGGRHSLTTFRLLLANDQKSWIEALPKTGRTHQIRLHCLERGAPILGDLLYNEDARSKNTDVTHALHAYRIDFRHPKSGKTLSLRAPPPGFWRETWLKGLADEASIDREIARLVQSAR